MPDAAGCCCSTRRPADVVRGDRGVRRALGGARSSAMPARSTRSRPACWSCSRAARRASRPSCRPRQALPRAVAVRRHVDTDDPRASWTGDGAAARRGARSPVAATASRADHAGAAGRPPPSTSTASARTSLRRGRGGRDAASARSSSTPSTSLAYDAVAQTARRSTCTARRAPTSARWPATSAKRSAAAVLRGAAPHRGRASRRRRARLARRRAADRSPPWRLGGRRARAPAAPRDHRGGGHAIAARPPRSSARRAPARLRCLADGRLVAHRRPRGEQLRPRRGGRA